MANKVEFREYVTSENVRVDRERCLIRNVKVLGYESRNGKRYTEATVRAAIDLYRGAPVNVNHSAKADDGRERPVEDRFGWLENVRHERDGLYADLRYLKSDPRSEKVAEIAESNPRLIGMSHHAYGSGRPDAKGTLIVEQITRVKSVDLVCDPATTRGLFESEDYSMGEDQMGAAPAAGSGDMTWDMFLAKAKSIYDGDGDPGAKGKAIGKLLTELLKIGEKLDSIANPETAEKKEMPAEEKAAEEAARSKQADEVASLKEQLRRMTAKESNTLLLESVGVKPDQFKLDALDKMPTDEARKALAESWKPVAAVEKPRSSGPLSLYESRGDDNGAYKPMKDSKEFAALFR